MFGSTYMCESVFYTMQFNKNRHRTILTDSSLLHLMRLTTTAIDVDIPALVNAAELPYLYKTEHSFIDLGLSYFIWNFRLILSPKKGVLHSKFKAYTVDGNGKEKLIFVDHDHFYDGRLFGEVISDASVHMEDGIITGIIHAPDETYHIEPSWRHLPDLDNRSMIIYRASDAHFSWEQGLGDSDTWPRTCAYVKEGPVNIWYNLQSDHAEEEELFREKRQADQYEYTPTKTRCPLLLVADYRFYQEMGGSNTKTTINYLISLIDRVHKIYNDTTWQDRVEQDGFKGMGFVIKKIVVHSEPTRVRGGEAHYNMVREKWDVRNLLEWLRKREVVGPVVEDESTSAEIRSMGAPQQATLGQLNWVMVQFLIVSIFICKLSCFYDIDGLVKDHHGGSFVSKEDHDFSVVSKP
uniref:Uncharacterized protein n=1 Tax=Timema tahoe TaxID=61484 RepID=A0A7R9FII4_9NEOP|nr:unnamed protein product [Timema tahoe]